MSSQRPLRRADVAGGAEPQRPGSDTPIVALDAMGGDHAPREIVSGAVAAVRERGIPVVLIGRRPELVSLLVDEGADREVPVVHAADALAMHEGALASWRRPRSSVAVACRLMRLGEVSALVSAGSTGAIVATATVRLRTLSGVLRPALAVDLPTHPRPTVLLDAGANADAKPEMLVQFAALGAAYATTAHGVEHPKVGVLTIGSEPGKGNRLARKSAELLAATAAESPEWEFHGNIEGHDLLGAQVDVAVTDGFTGNVALKSTEGAVRFLLQELRTAHTATPLSRLGARLARGPLRELSRRLAGDYAAGAVLLGLNGTVVIAHGASGAHEIEQACARAHQLASGGIVDQLRRSRRGAGRSPRS